jgi:hypothetical protein
VSMATRLAERSFAGLSVDPPRRVSQTENCFLQPGYA